MSLMTTAEEEIKAAARKRERSKAAFERDDAALRELFVKWRAAGEGPSDMARWSGMTRECGSCRGWHVGRTPRG